jgi:hypothetical protein
MHKGRLGAFSDGVLAIIITIMVLGLKAPVSGHGVAALRDLAPLWLVYLSYALRFANGESHFAALAAAIGRDVKGNLSAAGHAKAGYLPSRHGKLPGLVYFRE